VENAGGVAFMFFIIKEIYKAENLDFSTKNT